MAFSATPVWPAFSAAPYSYRDALARLRDYDGAVCLWRVVIGVFAFAAVPLLAIGGYIAGIYIAGDLHDFWRVLLGAIVALGPGQFASLCVWQHRPWDKLIADRLLTYEETEGPGDLNAIIQPEDFLRATKALRRTKLCPRGGTHMPTSPPGAENLTLKLIVGQPSRWHQPDAPELHVQIRECLRDAHIRARIAGVDVYP